MKADAVEYDSNSPFGIGDNAFFPSMAMDYTGTMLPGVDVPQLASFENQRRYAQDLELDHAPQFSSGGNRRDGHVSNKPPGQNEPKSTPGPRRRRSEKGYGTETVSSVANQAMEVDSTRPASEMTRQDSGGSSTACSHRLHKSQRDTGKNFERILDIVEEAGFDSIDSMAGHYYSAKFEANSITHMAQANSRSRNLRRLLQTQQKTSTEWTKQETQAYEEEIVRSATSICHNELRVFRARRTDSQRRPSVSRTETTPSNSSSSSISQSRSSMGTVDQLRQLLHKEESSQPTQQEKRLLRQCVPETWSLLSELGTDVMPAQVSQAVYTFLHTISAGASG